MANSLVWQISPQCNLKWRLLDDQWIVYHVESGDTHSLNDTAATSLKLLQKNPYSVQELQQQLMVKLDIQPDEHFQHQLRDMLDTFHTLGILEVRNP